jgi:hypothetical protein
MFHVPSFLRCASLDVLSVFGLERVFAVESCGTLSGGNGAEGHGAMGGGESEVGLDLEGVWEVLRGFVAVGRGEDVVGKKENEGAGVEGGEVEGGEVGVEVGGSRLSTASTSATVTGGRSMKRNAFTKVRDIKKILDFNADPCWNFSQDTLYKIFDELQMDPSQRVSFSRFRCAPSTQALLDSSVFQIVK